MKRVLFVLLFPILLFAQALEFSGYFEPQMTGLSIQDEFYNFSANKVRLDLNTDYKNVSFGANVNYISYHGKTEWNVLDYLPNRVTQGIPADLRSFYVFHFGDMAEWTGAFPTHRADRIYLDNAYLNMHFKNSDLIIGKQQLSFGTGYTWNPTDLFNSKDVLDPTYEQPGHNAVRWMLQLGSIHHIDVIYTPGEQWEDSGKMLRYSTWLGRFDLSIVAAQVTWANTNYNFTSMLTNPDFMLNADPTQFEMPQATYTRNMIGGDLAGELFGIGLWSELAYNFKDDDLSDENLEWVVGADYTFENSLYVMAEWMHSSAAPDNWQDYTLNDWMRMFTAETKSMCRNQLYAMAMYPITDLITFNISTISSLSDASIGFIPMLMWNIFEDVELNLFGYFYAGDDGRLYASNMGNGGMARFRIYF